MGITDFERDSTYAEVGDQLDGWAENRVVLNERTRRLLLKVEGMLRRAGAVRIRRFGVHVVRADGHNVLVELQHPSSQPPDTRYCVVWAYCEAARLGLISGTERGIPGPDAVHASHRWEHQGSIWFPECGMSGLNRDVMVYDLDDRSATEAWAKIGTAGNVL